MSFDIICKGCGAASSPSVGVCPFCKTILTSKRAGKDSPTITNIKKFYNDGKVDRTLALLRVAEEKKTSLLKNPNFVLIYVKTLLEVDGPSSKIKGLLSYALLENPNSPILTEYLEVADARSNLSRNRNDVGEVELSNIIRRSPKNIHALFLLGSHLFWIEKETQRPLKYLESCYRLRPKFLRATACLGALYKELGLDSQASRLFRECAVLETQKSMKAYFRELAAK